MLFSFQINRSSQSDGVNIFGVYYCQSHSKFSFTDAGLARGYFFLSPLFLKVPYFSGYKTGFSSLSNDFK